MKRRDFIKVLPILFIALTNRKSLGSNLEPKSTVGYQDHPNNGQMCRMCKFFIPPNGMEDMMNNMRMIGMMGMNSMRGMMHGKCKVVAGNISPMGWCKLFSPL